MSLNVNVKSVSTHTTYLRIYKNILNLYKCIRSWSSPKQSLHQLYLVVITLDIGLVFITESWLKCRFDYFLEKLRKKKLSANK